ncbi:OmpA family protein [Bradyrhizobium sp.]|uniref:OmpA family protein n=1 Tax=Bradyrhizobium sp. TaxID=376 RepID=UPI0025B84D2F|nr:OmpA family protein [Bradyrhizobium sp.]
MFRATGPGQIEVSAGFSGIGVLQALLWNFDFDDFAGYKFRGLKPQHSAFLKDKVFPLLENDTGQIWMCGAASRIGTAGWNMDLSRNRVITVAGYLSELGIPAEQMQTDAIGNTQTATHALDEDRDRSVLLRVVPKIHFKPIVKPDLPRPLPPKPKVSRNFKIAMLLEVDGSISFAAKEFIKKIVKGRVGAGIAFASAIFSIWDTENHLKCTYVYAAVGLGVGLNLPKTGGRSGTLHGDWTAFTTEKPISCSQFGRTMRFTTIGIGDVSKTWVRIETPPGVDDVYISIATGTTIGGGASTFPAHTSAFIPLEHPKPFAGP